MIDRDTIAVQILDLERQKADREAHKARIQADLDKIDGAMILCKAWLARCQENSDPAPEQDQPLGAPQLLLEGADGKEVLGQVATPVGN